MFGSTAFMVSGKLCMSARAERIMCRIDPALHDEAMSRPGCRTVVMRGREYRGWVRVDKAALKTRAQLAYWIGLALTFNKGARPARKRRPRGARPATR
jgi:hypothetical protein